MAVKAPAIDIAKNFWPQGFNEHNCGFMIPEGWSGPVQIGLRNTETFATSFVTLDKPEHLSLIKRMQRACYLRYVAKFMHISISPAYGSWYKQRPHAESA